MNITTLRDTIKGFLDTKIDPLLLFDTVNDPFVSVSIIYLKSGQWLEESFSRNLNIGQNSSKAVNHMELIALSKVMQASHLESRDEDNQSLKTDYGFCSSLILNQHCHIVISIIANSEDCPYIFTTLKNKVEILCGIY